jgi:hypothetical protein
MTKDEEMILFAKDVSTLGNKSVTVAKDDFMAIVAIAEKAVALQKSLELAATVNQQLKETISYFANDIERKLHAYADVSCDSIIADMRKQASV